MSSSKSKSDSYKWAVFSVVSLIDIALLLKLLNSQDSAGLLIWIGILTLLLILTLAIDRLIGINLSAKGLEAKLSDFKEQIEGQVHEEGNKIKSKVDSLGKDINTLLISTVLDAFEYITLRKILGKEENDDYDFNPKGQDLLERLRNRGLIDEAGGDSIFNDKHGRKIKLRDHLFITDRGKIYLEVIDEKGLGEQLYTIAVRAGFKKK